MTESTLYPEILAAHSRGPTRLFRTNAGTAWQGVVAERTDNLLVLIHPRVIKLGCMGMSDLTGWTTVGDTAVYTAIEVKSPRGRPTAEQTAFLELVRRSGGRSGIARSVEDAEAIIAGRTP